MTDVKRGFKVTCHVRGQHQPCTFSGAAHGAPYRPDKWTERQAGCGPLCVFDTLDTSFFFGGNRWECEYEPSADTDVWTPDGHRDGRFPPGTVLADRVKLLRRVDDA